MKCCNRNCDKKAVGRVDGITIRRCTHHERQYRSNRNRKKKWNPIDIGKGKCYRKGCNRFAGKNEKGLCDMHEHYRRLANEKKDWQLPERKEMARRRNQSTRLSDSKIEVPRLKRTVPALPTFIQATGNKLKELFDRRIEEIYQ